MSVNQSHVNQAARQAINAIQQVNAASKLAAQQAKEQAAQVKQNGTPQSAQGTTPRP